MEKTAYTKGQVFWGTFLGGPVAPIYFLKKNFDAMGNNELSQKTIKLGTLLFLSLALIIPFLPDVIPGAAYSIAYAFAARMIYEQNQISLEGTPRYSNWNVVGYALLWLVVAILGIMLVAFFYDFLGVVDLSASEQTIDLSVSEQSSATLP